MNAPASKHHIVISGTGRSGTTFLVQLLTRLGLDTGFSQQEAAGAGFFSDARAGLEHDVRAYNAPYIVKSPYFCEYAEEVLRRDDIHIDHVLVPIRDLHAAAESRRYVVRSTLAGMSIADRLKFHLKPRELPGGLWRTASTRQGAQETVLLRQVYALMLALAGYQVPVTILRYPRLVRDSDYCFEKLRPILGGITHLEFMGAFRECARPDLVHEFGSADG